MGWQHRRVQELLAEENGNDGPGLKGDVEEEEGGGGEGGGGEGGGGEEAVRVSHGKSAG
jgi:hypothetical protein